MLFKSCLAPASFTPFRHPLAVTNAERVVRTDADTSDATGHVLRRTRVLCWRKPFATETSTGNVDQISMAMSASARIVDARYALPRKWNNGRRTHDYHARALVWCFRHSLGLGGAVSWWRSSRPWVFACSRLSSCCICTSMYSTYNGIGSVLLLTLVVVCFAVSSCILGNTW